MRFCLWALFCLGLGCSEGSHAPSIPSPDGQNEKSLLTHAGDIQPIWDQSCTSGCHPGNDSMLSLEPDYAWKTMVGIPSVEVPLMDRVEPGEPDQSYLVHKIEDTHLNVGGMGFAMPNFSDLLAEEEIQNVRDWITQGAVP
jgi:hypothetical protein